MPGVAAPTVIVTWRVVLPTVALIVTTVFAATDPPGGGMYCTTSPLVEDRLPKLPGASEHEGGKFVTPNVVT